MTKSDVYRIVRAVHLGRTVRMAELDGGNYGSHTQLIPEDPDEQLAYLLGSTDYDVECAVREGRQVSHVPDWLVLW